MNKRRSSQSWLNSLVSDPAAFHDALVEAMTSSEAPEAVEEDEPIDIRKERWELWKPNPGQQEYAYNSRADILGYGGQAGGGKSHLVLGTYATRHYRGVVFRRTEKQAADLISDFRDILSQAKDEGRWNGTEKTFRFRDGRSLQFAGLERPEDWQKHKGRPKDFIAFDEATEFLESQVRAIMGWLRTTRANQRTQVVLTFNPPTSVEGEWVLRFFAPWLDETHPNPALPGELRWFTTVAGKDVECDGPDPVRVEKPNGEAFYVRPLSRTFIPASLEDNPFLRESGYDAQLNALPEPLRSQLLFGDFKAGIRPNAWQVCPTEWVKLAMKRWTSEGGKGKPLDVIGMDVARGGADSTVGAPRYGPWFAPLLVEAGENTPDGNSAARLIVDHHSDDAPIHVDVIGYGSSAYEKLSDPPPEGYGLPAVPVNVSESSDFRDRSGKFGMANKRAEMWWRLREALDPEYGDDIALPPDNELLRDLTAPEYVIRPSGIQIEDKKKTKKRIGKSPDRGDAVALAMLPTDDIPFAFGDPRRPATEPFARL